MSIGTDVRYIAEEVIPIEDCIDILFEAAEALAKESLINQKEYGEEFHNFFLQNGIFPVRADEEHGILQKYADVVFAMQLVFPDFEPPEFSERKYELYCRAPAAPFRRAITLASLELSKYAQQYRKALAGSLETDSIIENIMWCYTEIAGAISCFFPPETYVQVENAINSKIHHCIEKTEK